MNYEDKHFKSIFDFLDQVSTPEGYPNRDREISLDDITDLMIALYTTKDVSQFLAVI
jgi:hypothetical protein